MRVCVLLELCLSLSAALAQAELANIASPSDEAIQADLERLYDLIPGLEAVRVTVTAGVARLEGEAANGPLREDALELARESDGVRYVVNRMSAVTNVQRSVSPVLERLRGFGVTLLGLLPLLGVALAIVFVFGWLGALLIRWHGLWERLGLNPLLQNFVRQLARLALLLSGLLLAFDLLGATSALAAVLGTAGVAGLAVGFALRDIVENYLAGMLLSLRQPFAKRDIIRLGEHEGMVVRLTASELVLMTRDGNNLRIPNATVFKSDLLNYTRNPQRRFEIVIGVDVQEDLSAVQRLGVKTLRDLEGVSREPGPFSLIRELDDAKVILQFFGWVDQSQHGFLRIRSRALRRLKERFDAEGVLMPEPSTNVRVHQAAGTSLGQSREGGRLEPSAEAVEAEMDGEAQLEAQVAEEVARSSEENLLTEERPRRKSS